MLPDPDTYLDQVEERFATSTDFTIGLEEEFQILDSGSLALTGAFELLRDSAPPELRESILGELISSEIEIATSKFLATATMINTGVGIATALALWAVGVPNPILWGGVAAVLNFVPYLGPITTATIITFTSFASFDDLTRALVAPACFVAIHLTENNLVTPMLLGRRLPVNTVAIFLGLLFFAWIWGVPGAVLAVPLTAVVKIACDHIPGLVHFGELLGN